MVEGNSIRSGFGFQEISTQRFARRERSTPQGKKETMNPHVCIGSFVHNYLGSK